MNNKSDLLKKSSTILLATVLVAGFIGISTPFSIFAQEYYDDYESEEYSQYYDDDYEKSYEKYMKDDYSKVGTQKISCNNIIKNQPDDSNVDTSNALALPNGNSQSSQDRMNANQKGNFVYVCQNNNNNIENNVNNGDTSFSFVNNNTLQQNQNGTFTTTMVCGNNIANTEGNFTDSDNVTTAINIGNNVQCTISQQIGNITDNSENNLPGLTGPSSIADVEQPILQSQQIKSKSVAENSGIEIQQQGSLPTGITQSQLLSPSQQSSKTSQTTIAQGIQDSPDLTATEKIIKLKQQWMELTP